MVSQKLYLKLLYLTLDQVFDNKRSKYKKSSSRMQLVWSLIFSMSMWRMIERTEKYKKMRLNRKAEYTGSGKYLYLNLKLFPRILNDLKKLLVAYLCKKLKAK